MKIKHFTLLLLLAIVVFQFSSCRGDDDEFINPKETIVAPPDDDDQPLAKGDPTGFFLLNEANMGSNKSTLDYFSFETGTYFKNIYPKLNPNVVHNLGDVGNDIQIYGNKIYAVINCSHLVDIMDLDTGKSLKNLTIQNCRYVVFHKGYAYVSSYNGPVKIEENTPIGCVVKVDTTNMTIVDKCTVGYQPEEMVIRDNKLYVANSGGYRVPNYDNTVSVIDLNSFTETKKIPVAINLHRMKLDSDKNIYVSSRGDYKKINSNTYIINKDDKVTKALNLSCSQMAVQGDSIYMYSVEWSHITEKNTVSYAIVNTKTQSIVSRNFITDGTDKKIAIPYGIAINPKTKDIYVTDAKDYVNPGTLYCFSPQGKKKWAVTTGDIPAHFVFTYKKFKPLDPSSNEDVEEIN